MNYIQKAKLVASDQVADDSFGSSVSLSADGNTAIVGAYGTDDSFSDAGSAYVFTRSGTTWSEQAKLVASDPEAVSRFGFSVALSADGNTAIVGASFDDSPLTDAGSAYVFTRSGTTWSEQAKLVASDQATGDHGFGVSVALSADGDTAIVGCYFDDNILVNDGSAYVFTRSGTTWSEQAKLVASDAVIADALGRGVSLSSDGNTAAVGSYRTNDVSTDAGSVYIFTRSGVSWSEQAKLVASDAGATAYAGFSVALSADGNTVVTGASFDDSPLANAGSAYVFTRSGTTWSEQAKLVASDQAASDQFGYSVSISDDGNTVVLGANVADNPITNAGSAYVFTRSVDVWVEHSKITSNDLAADDRLGQGVSISSDGKTLLIGAWLSDSPLADAGSAYIFVNPDWPQEPQYKPESTKLSEPASGLVPVTPSDVADLTEPTRYLMVATGGDVYVDMYGVGTNIKLPALIAGRLYPIRVSRVYATGTTATGISSFY